MNRLLRLISLLCIAASPSIAAAEKPNIVFVMIDDLGAEQVGCYGSETYKTPHIDKLATKGMLFNNAFAQPMCQISRATLMSGQYGFRNGFPKNNARPSTRKKVGGRACHRSPTCFRMPGTRPPCRASGTSPTLIAILTDQGFEYQNAGPM